MSVFVIMKRNNFSSSKTSWRRLWRRIIVTLKMFTRSFQDVFNASSQKVMIAGIFLNGSVSLWSFKCIKHSLNLQARYKQNVSSQKEKTKKETVTMNNKTINSFPLLKWAWANAATSYISHLFYLLIRFCTDFHDWLIS